ncbi:MAG: DUF1540 domain-containing protein [Acutalibacteraceae bacterium]
MNCSDEANKSIGCTVTKCMYHCNESNNCTLDKVSIGTHESNPTQCQCVDCESFVPKN